MKTVGVIITRHNRHVISILGLLIVFQFPFNPSSLLFVIRWQLVALVFFDHFLKREHRQYYLDDVYAWLQFSHHTTADADLT